jgi:DNA modification methylase
LKKRLFVAVSEVHLLDGRVTLYHGDCLDVMKSLGGIDACVTDPPYHLASIVKRFGAANAAPAKHGNDGSFGRLSKGFMGKEWDGGDISFNPETWEAISYSLLPGAHLVSFAATRNYHRMACAIEDAGFEIRDMLSWLYGNGFPKSHDTSKAIDKAAGVQRELIRTKVAAASVILGGIGGNLPWKDKAAAAGYHEHAGNEAVTEDAKKWEGWGTALKPACEPICLARKPLSESTVAGNVLEYGTGALNIEECRLEDKPKSPGFVDSTPRKNEIYGNDSKLRLSKHEHDYTAKGRFPANVLHDGSDEVVDIFPSEEVSRYFYCTKTSTEERSRGLKEKNSHPTVKPIALMEYLCKLITPKDGFIIDPFMGSGSTGIAAINQGFRFIGIEKDKNYFDIAVKRIEDSLGIFKNL